MSLILALLIWLSTEAVTVIGPAYPPNAFSGGNVVAVLHVESGSVAGVEVLAGDAPFVAPVRAALARWRFQDSTTSDVLVVVNYRTPNLYPTGSAAQEVARAQERVGLPYPRTVVEPAYPPNSLAEGSVVLQLMVSETGNVMRVTTIQGLGGLTGAAQSAARKWQFKSARNSKGAAVSSEVYAVCVVRRPLINK